MTGMNDQIDLGAASFIASPQIATWQRTIAITEIVCDEVNGFRIVFDHEPPDTWKFFTGNPDQATDHYLYTVFFGKELAGVWFLAGFVEMWRGRAQGPGHPIPPLLVIPPGDIAPGYVNLWGDPRQLWPPLSSYVPSIGDRVAIVVAAGDGRMKRGITSVAERSNVVLWTVGTGVQEVLYADVVTPGDPPSTLPPPVGPPADEMPALAAIADLRRVIINALTKPAPDYTATLKVPFLGTFTLNLTPVVPKK